MNNGQNLISIPSSPALAASPTNRFRLEAADCLLMLIDLQIKLIPVINKVDLAVKKTLIMTEIAKDMEIPIILTEQYPEGLGPTAPALLEACQATAIKKLSFSACIPEVQAALAGHNRRQILICGMETHVCVYQTVRQLLSDGYAVFVISDAVCSRTEANYLNGLALMQQMGAIVTNVETVLFDLLQAAGTQQFKRLSKLIR